MGPKTTAPDPRAGTRARTARTPRAPLTRERVLQSASDLADRDGIEALTMRALADSLGVEAMSIYYHLPNKSAILDGVIDLTFTEIGAEVAETAMPPTDAAGWALAVRERIL